jgi:hypothetical protein
MGRETLGHKACVLDWRQRWLGLSRLAATSIAGQRMVNRYYSGPPKMSSYWRARETPQSSGRMSFTGMVQNGASGSSLFDVRDATPRCI